MLKFFKLIMKSEDGFWIPLAMMAGGMIKNQFDKKANQRQNDAQIAQTKYSALTGMGPGQIKSDPSTIGAGLKWGAAGLGLQQGLAAAAAGGLGGAGAAGAGAVGAGAQGAGLAGTAGLTGAGAAGAGAAGAGAGLAGAGATGLDAVMSGGTGMGSAAGTPMQSVGVDPYGMGSAMNVQQPSWQQLQQMQQQPGLYNA